MKKIGRPRLPKSVVRTKIVRFLVNEKELKYLEEEAAKLSWSVPIYARFVSLNLLVPAESASVLKAKIR
jgi:hypothetical protein